MEQILVRIASLQHMLNFAYCSGLYFNNNRSLVYVEGDLGAGKTTFTKEVARSMGINDNVTSPTFNIFKRYQGMYKYLNHFDIYRIEDNVYDQGFEEYWFSEDVTIIEWSNLLPDEFKDEYTVKLEFKLELETEARLVKINASKAYIDYIKENCDESIFRY